MYEEMMIVVYTLTSKNFLITLALVAIIGMGLFIANSEE